MLYQVTYTDPGIGTEILRTLDAPDAETAQIRTAEALAAEFRLSPDETTGLVLGAEQATR